MFGPTEVRELFQYNRAVLERYERALRRLTWRQLSRNRESGHLSLKDTYLHIIQVHDGWLNYILPGRVKEMAQRPDPYRFRSWREIRAWEAGVWRHIESQLESLTPREIRREVKAPWMPGHYTAGDAFMQTTLEQAHHLGEIIAMFWQMDRAPPEMTWIDTRRMVGRRRKG
jgi:uncharacterized damage-inducible protein DinB